MPIASDLLINFTRGDHLSAIVNVFDARTITMLAVLEQIRDAFGLDTAVGDQLDRIGGVVQLERLSGQSDSVYRLLLRVQIELILSSTGRPGSLMRIVELVSGAPPTHYAEFYPRTVHIGVLTDGSVDLDLLLQKLRQAVIGAVRVVIEAVPVNALILDYTPTNPVAGLTLVLDYTPTNLVVGAGVLAYEFTI